METTFLALYDQQIFAWPDDVLDALLADPSPRFAWPWSSALTACVGDRIFAAVRYGGTTYIFGAGRIARNSDEQAKLAAAVDVDWEPLLDPRTMRGLVPIPGGILTLPSTPCVVWGHAADLESLWSTRKPEGNGGRGGRRSRLGRTEVVARFGARLRNRRSSWDAVRADGSVLFVGWDYLLTCEPSGAPVSCQIFKYGSPDNAKAGGQERSRYIEAILASGEAAYLIIATPKRGNVEASEIGSVSDELYIVRLERDAEFVHARIIGKNTDPVAENETIRDIEDVATNASIPETERTQLIQARRGQGVFRLRLEVIELGCRVTRVVDRAHLRASHIKPWRHATNAERLDGHNGLLLAPHVDHLFDRGYITFAPSGSVLVSPQLDRTVLAAWGILGEREERRPLTDRQQYYLQFHRRNVFRQRAK